MEAVPSMQDEEETQPITSLEEYGQIMWRLSLLESRAEMIANKLCSRNASFRRFEIDRVVYEYNGSCNCHPEEGTDSFPAALLFDPDWEAKHEAAKLEAERLRVEAEAKERERVEAAAARKRERDERSAYERLRKKYGPAGEDA